MLLIESVRPVEKATGCKGPPLLIISSTPVLIPEYIKEVAHILMGIDIAKEVEKEQSWRVITGRTVELTARRGRQQKMQENEKNLW